MNAELEARFALAGVKTVSLGLVGNLHDGTHKWELHINPASKLVCVKTQTNVPIGQMTIEQAARMSDPRWQCAAVLGRAWLEQNS